MKQGDRYEVIGDTETRSRSRFYQEHLKVHCVISEESDPAVLVHDRE